jgi:hypothetical protein
MSVLTQCPRCSFEQPPSPECGRCGVIFARLRAREAETGPETLLARVLAPYDDLYIEQHALHWWEILFNWEQRNEYQVNDVRGREVVSFVEQGGGFLRALARVFLGSHRPFDIAVFTPWREVLFEMKRAFTWMFTVIEVRSVGGRPLGRVRRRFAWFNKVYDLEDERGAVFARIRGPWWRIWTFHLFDAAGREVGALRKRWSGLAREMFTDADRFQLDLGRVAWTPAQRAVLLAAAIAVDFDFFENNQGN